MMNARPLIIGTRGSSLALAQTNLVRALIHRVHPRLEIEIKIIKTSGDRLTKTSLAHSGVKGIFTKELEQALFRNRIDLAIHSLKDMPVAIPAGLVLAAIVQREDPADVLVGHPSTNLDEPAVVFTSSPRRAFQAKLLWPRCESREIRGNVETRLNKIAEGTSGEAVLLAAAGLRRLDFLKGDDVLGALRLDPALPFRRLSIEEMIPAPGQAAIALEIRNADGELREKLRPVNHAATSAAVSSERAFLGALGGGCATPVAAHARVGLDGLNLVAVVQNENGSIWRGERQGERRNAENIGRSLAEACLSRV